MRIPSLAALIVAAATLTACESSTGNDARVVRYLGQLDASGNARQVLPANQGTFTSPPALACYTADPNASGANRVWYVIASVDGVSNCLLEPQGDGRLAAVIEGETPFWDYAFVVTY